MNLFDYLAGRDERRLQYDLAALAKEPCPGFWERLLPADFRGWLGLGLFLQSTFLFTLLAAFGSLRESQGFLTLASAVIVTGWIGGAAAFAYAAGKSSAERSEQVSSALRLAEQSAGTGNGNGGPDAGTARPAGAEPSGASGR